MHFCPNTDSHFIHPSCNVLQVLLPPKRIHLVQTKTRSQDHVHCRSAAELKLTEVVLTKNYAVLFIIQCTSTLRFTPAQVCLSIILVIVRRQCINKITVNNRFFINFFPTCIYLKSEQKCKDNNLFTMAKQSFYFSA